MNRIVKRFCAAATLLGFGLHSALAGPAVITVQADQPGHKIPPTLWGIFFEDINLSADGGIYPERVRNRNFEDTAKPDHWTLLTNAQAKAEMSIDTEKPVSAKNPRCLKIVVTDPAGSRAGVVNGGFYGIAVEKGESFRLSLKARADGGFSGPLTVSLESSDGSIVAQEKISKLTTDWRNFAATLAAKTTDPKARLVISTTKPGTFWLDMVSLFPKQTWKNHGLRPDLMEKLAGLKPAFNRFPGGCWVEGDRMKEAYRWKQTIGDPSERRTQHNIWQYEATHGVGFHEYLVMCEDLGCEPLFVINCGMSHKENVPLEQMDEFVQDALDAIEYANGPVTSKWGAVRAQAGHPAPFGLKYMEIGNENGGPAYRERWALFHKAIKSRYPEIQLVANHWSGGYPTNPMPEIVDEHYYNNPEFFMAQAGRYDKYDRHGPKIYIGEYAVTSGAGLGNLRGAIGEAAFMTGMERNSDVVIMGSYAPLFCHANHKRWPINLINYDGARVFGIPSYYVQQMFSQNRGDVTLPITVDAPPTEAGPKGGAIGVGTWLTQAEFKDIKVTRGGEPLYSCDFANGTQGWKLLGNGDWQAQDGVLRQNSRSENVRAVAGDRKWTDYTYSLKARKLGGAEGFLILFRTQRDNEKSWWNLGGWGNRRHAIEMGGVIGQEVEGSIETGRWYDIRVELTGSHIKCYLDGKLIHDVTAPLIQSLYASASRDDKTGETILKVVNVAAAAQETEIKLNGVAKLASAQALVLTSESSTDENTLDNPTKVSPKSQKLATPTPSFQHSFPGNSLTVLRFKGRP
ncbi:MAG: carbohydrate binding domain-containing protein [Verrucomicrobia bacterium]|nr:carbohydrate binding domain-containing protein [Verrucomicrobiota bacterium]